MGIGIYTIQRTLKNKALSHHEKQCSLSPEVPKHHDFRSEIHFLNLNTSRHQNLCRYLCWHG